MDHHLSTSNMSLTRGAVGAIIDSKDGALGALGGLNLMVRVLDVGPVELIDINPIGIKFRCARVRIWDGDKVGDVLVSGKHDLVERNLLKERDIILVRKLHRSRSSEGKLIILLSDIAIATKHKFDLGFFSAFGEEEENQEADGGGEGTKASKASFTWKLDPDESFSDWTIIVNGVDTYHVHRCIMGAGRRSSRYFERIFRMERPLQENQNSQSNIALDQETAVTAFPTMLDYMYSKGENVRATTETAVALRFLASYFNVESLWNNVNNTFIQKDINVKTAPTYLMEASSFQDHSLISLTSDFCAANFYEIDISRWGDLSPDLFRGIVTRLDNRETVSRANDGSDGNGDDDKFTAASGILREKTPCLSEIVAEYCRAQRYRPGYLSADFLLEVTDIERMPDMEPGAALTILRHAHVAQCLDEVDEDAGASLRERCISSIARGWSRSLVPKIKSSEGDEDSDYNNLPLDIKNAILERVVLEAHRNLGSAA